MIKKILHSTSLKANIIANFIGNGWTAVISLLCVPIYLKYIGAEGYGLIGVFSSLQVVLTLLDSGLSTVLNKELARLSNQENPATKMRNLVKTLGTYYWLAALVVGLIAMILSPLIAKYWVHPQKLSVQTITYAFLLLSLALIFQFPAAFYNGGLLGLQRQVALNFIKIIFATFRSVGAILVLVFVSKTILAFFSWTLFISVLQVFISRSVLWHYLPKSVDKIIFDKDELKRIWRFAAGMTAISLTSILLTQTDMMVLSKLLSLEQFGYYAFSFTVGSIPYMIVNPISQSYFPKFTILIAEENPQKLRKLYHQGCQLVTLLVLPFALFLSIFSEEILLIWTNNHEAVKNTWLITSFVTLGVAIHCLMFVPYVLSLAYGKIKLALYTNIAILILLIPSTIYAAIHLGGIGGALCWLGINLIYLIINPILFHKLYLKGETLNWYWNDTFKPIIGCIIILFIAKYTLSYYHFNYFITIVILVFTGIFAFISTLLSIKGLKKIIIKIIP